MFRTTSRTLAGALALAVALVACGGGGAGITPKSSVAGPSGPTSSGPTTSSPNLFIWGKALQSQLSYVGPIASNTQQLLSVNVLVSMQNAAGLVQYAQQANDPHSGAYRHWLTPEQIGSEYGATSANYATVSNYFIQNGLHAAGWPQREILTVSGTVAQFQKAFGTSFGLYTYEGKTVAGPTGTPHFSAPLPVSAVFGLVAARTMRSYSIMNNNASYFGYSPQQLGTGLDYSGAWNNGFTGQGINVGIIGTGPILNASGADADTAGLGTFWNAAVGSIKQVAASAQPASQANGNTGTGAVDPFDVFLATPPPVNPYCNFSNPSVMACNPEDGEAQLDTESVSSLAPGATTLFYLAYEGVCLNATTGFYAPPCASTDTFLYAEGINLVDDEIQQAIADNQADVISMSFGGPENLNLASGYIGPVSAPGLGNIEMASLAAEGIAIFASSGDDGAWDCQSPTTGLWLGTPCVSYPASDPNVVAVGGINIPLDESGNLTGEITAWADNTTLGGNGSFGNNVGSGGGVSSVYSAPSWQAATTGATMRELPDVSLDADPKTGPSILLYAGYAGYRQMIPIGGTSAAAPEAAAQWGIVLSACKATPACAVGGNYRLGNPAAYYYAAYGTGNSLATGTYAVPNVTASPLPYAGVFYDVLYGDNQAVPPTTATPSPAATPNGYNSGPGYDQVTGIGAPFTGHLVQSVTGNKVP